MNKKILLGSIIAVAILIGISFSGVVGYQTTKSSTIARASPLFKIRTSRAIGLVQKQITTDYLGHEEETNIPLPSRMKRAELTQKAINIIIKMDERAFSKIVARIILHLKNQEQIKDKETTNFLQTLYYIRKNPNNMKYSDVMNNPIAETSEYVSCRWIPGCYIFLIVSQVFTGIISLLVAFSWITYWIYVAITGGPTLIDPNTCIPDTAYCCP